MNNDERWPHLADRNDIDAWASTLLARSKFPTLIRRLINQTNDQLVQLEMRSDEGVGLPGYDGTSEANQATPFVPAGKAVWELGTNADPLHKANADYRARKNDPLHVNPAETTFVFVSPRQWKNKVAWAAEKRDDGFWKDVRTFDIDDIDQALDQAPAVRCWLSEIIGKPGSGVQTIEEWWTTYSGYTNPRLTPEMALAGRADDAAALLRILQEEVRRTLIRARGVDEVLAFIAATILSTDENSREKYLGSTLIVRDTITLRRLDSASNILALLPYNDHFRRDAELIQNHHVIFLCTDDGDVDINLRDLEHDTFKSILLDLGVPESRALELTRAACRGLTTFHRVAAVKGKINPPWTQHSRNTIVRRSWLLGGWNARRSGDVDVLESLLDVTIASAEEHLLPLTQMDDPVFSAVGSVWGSITPDASWEFIRSAVTSSDLQKLERAIQTVFGAIDPALDLPIAERWRAGALGKSRIHSSKLRRSLAQTLALLGSRDEKKTFASGQTGPAWASKVIASLLFRANEDTTAQLWLSIGDILPLLAEAAPHAFLEAVQQATEGRHPIAKKLFTDGDSAISVDSPHTGLLWALEGIAWSGTYFSQAALILTRLAEIDPGGKLANRPETTLKDLFLPALPQTLASATARAEVLDVLLTRHPESGWKLILALLTHSPAGLAVHHYVFRFRQWGFTDIAKSTDDEQREIRADIADRAIKIAKSEPEKWATLSELILNFPTNERAKAYSILKTLDPSILTDEARRDIHEGAMKKVRLRRSRSESRWAVKPSDLNELERVAIHIQPNNTIQNSRWLFDSWHPNLGYRSLEDYESYESDLTARRVAAIAEIYSDMGLPGVDELLGVTGQNTWTVGHALAGQSVENTQSIIARLESDDSRQQNFARGFIFGRTQGDLNLIRGLIAPTERNVLIEVRALNLCSDHTSVWTYVRDRGEDVEQAYWKEFQPYGLGVIYESVNEAIHNLLAYNRPAMALDLISIYSGQTNPPIDGQLAVEAIRNLRSDDPEIKHLRHYGLERALGVIRAGSIDQDIVASLEWRLLPILGFEAGSPALDHKLATDPAFFVEVLMSCMGPREPREEAEVPTAVTTNAYRLLSEWKVIPGTIDKNGHVDQAALEAWVDEARRSLAEVDRSDIGDQYIGQVLAYAVADMDGTWPERPVREIIDTTASHHVDLGFCIGIYNKRGVTSRGLFDGGTQEHDLANRYGQWATLTANAWPRTAANLRTVESHYHEQGRREDEEAERRRQGLDD